MSPTKSLDELIRDLTKTMPEPVAKSYARRRVNEYLSTLKAELLREVKYPPVYQGNEILVNGEKKSGPVMFQWDFDEMKQQLEIKWLGGVR